MLLKSELPKQRRPTSRSPSFNRQTKMNPLKDDDKREGKVSGRDRSPASLYGPPSLDSSNIFAVIMAGGSGTRFWPLSTINKPKQLLSLTGDSTPIQQTVSRILPLISEQNIFIVTNKLQQEELRKQISKVSAIPAHNIIVEPVGRNTLPCIGLAALYIKAKSYDQSSIMVVLPSDHFIRDEKRFLKLLSDAQEVAQEGSSIVTFGIMPNRPETGYGYIALQNKVCSINDTDVFKAERFTEKPDKRTAAEFVASGKYLWNSGMFLWRTSVLLDMIEKFVPDIFRKLSKLEAAIGTPDEQEIIQEAYSQMRSISVDYAIMEKADNVLVIPADIGWSDVGSWAAMDEVWQKDANGNACKMNLPRSKKMVDSPSSVASPDSGSSGQHISIDTSDCVIYSDKLVATIGLKDLIVVETEEALLVCPKSRAQEVKKISSLLGGKPTVESGKK